MRASDVRPCAVCGAHPLNAHGHAHLTFFVVTIDRAVLDLTAARQVAGLELLLNGATRVAEALAPNPAVLTLPSELRLTLHVCEECAGELNLWHLLEQAGRAPAGAPA